MSRADRLALALEVGELVLPPGDLVVLNAEPLPFLELLRDRNPRCAQGFRPSHDSLRARGFDVAAEAQPPADVVIVSMTRARAASQHLTARGLELLRPGGMLVVSGDKTQGADALARAIAPELAIDGQFFKAHGRAFWMTAPDNPPPIIGEWRRAGETRRNAAGFFTAPGMFSPDHPDPGSIKLAELLPGRLSGRIADLGAGWGWLAHQALDSNAKITHFDLHEADAAALDAARMNLSDPRADFHWTDVTRLERVDKGYDAVISNPPFHHGRAAEPQIGRDFIAAAARVLSPGGKFLMVANRQLPYEAALDAAFAHWEQLHQDGTYKVILAKRPRRKS